MSSKVVKNTKYRHFKTRKLYEVIEIALHDDTLEDMVLYRALYNCEKFGLNRLWITSSKAFLEEMVEDVDITQFEFT